MSVYVRAQSSVIDYVLKQTECRPHEIVFLDCSSFTQLPMSVDTLGCAEEKWTVKQSKLLLQYLLAQREKVSKQKEPPATCMQT